MANLIDEPYLLINQACLEPSQSVPGLSVSRKRMDMRYGKRRHK